MAHIHTGAGEHDLTVSGYVVRMRDDEPLVLVHMHRKFGKLMQAGGHVELDETPWAAIAHELQEETGYTLRELSVLQPSANPFVLQDAVTHPVPALINTHRVSADHLHIDLCYAFIALAEPHERPGEDESQDIRWLTLEELKREVEADVAFADVYQIYETMITHYLEQYEWVHADDFSIEDPMEGRV
jgi:8-oxo-dGTP pyrophosphatase MutT (NUDIX family)